MVNKKGMSYSLEALIAITIVLVALVTVFNQLPPPQRQGLSFAEKNGLTCLRSLDQEGRLRADAVTQNTSSIRQNLVGCIRGTFNHTVQVCKNTCTAPALDRDQDVVSAKYYVAGANATDPTLVILYIWSSL
ncbi:MAG: hypothetical protein HY366_00135 [Candidatus Aenigmarchaeota archaeon]|nr:hypothetical protein [Candidatus Aenigmarchaeota archaeon]